MLINSPSDQANKYTRGKLTVIAGCQKYPGAAALAGAAGYSALRCGAGYAQVVTHRDNVRAVQAFRPSLVVSAWDEAEGLAPFLTSSAPQAPRAYVVGPGFDGQDALCHRLVLEALDAQAPLVVDGGGLAALTDVEAAAKLDRRMQRGLATAITPHGGEAARLARPLGIETADQQSLAVALARAYGVVAVVKGPVTWISDGQRSFCMDEGTPALAKAGTGDVLAGMLGGILAQNPPSDDPRIQGERWTNQSAYHAACFATRLHALAGRIAQERMTSIACTAEDVVEAIGPALKRMATQ